MAIRSLLSSNRVGIKRDGASIGIPGGISGGASFSVESLSPYLLDYNDATFTRTSEASFVDPRNNWSFAATGSGNYQSFYHLQDSSLESGWTITNAAITSSLISSPNGGTSVEIGDWNISAGNAQLSITASGSNSMWTFRVFLKKDENEGRIPEFMLTNGIGEPSGLQVNTKTGDFAIRSGTFDGNPVASVVSSGDWWDCSLSRIVFGNPIFRIYPSVGNAGTLGTNFSGTPTGSVIVAQATIKEDLHDAWKTANKPRIFSDGAVLIEGPRTNSLLYSKPTTGYAQAASTASTTLGFDGLFDSAARVSGTIAAAYNIYLPATGSHVSTSLSAYHRADTAKNWRWYYRDGLTLKNPTAATSSAAWERAAITLTDFDNRIGWNNGSDANTDPMNLFNFQLETGSFSTSPIRTNGAAATRGQEALSIDPSNINRDFYLTGFEMDIWPAYDAIDQISAGSYVISFTGTSQRYLLISKVGNGVRLLYRNAANAWTVTTFSFNFGDRITARVVHGSTFSAYVNDALVQTVNVTGDWNDMLTGSNPVNFGQTNFFGVISRPRRLT